MVDQDLVVKFWQIWRWGRPAAAPVSRDILRSLYLRVLLLKLYFGDIWIFLLGQHSFGLLLLKLLRKNSWRYGVLLGNVDSNFRNGWLIEWGGGGGGGEQIIGRFAHYWGAPGLGGALMMIIVMIMVEEEETFMIWWSYWWSCFCSYYDDFGGE